MGICFENPKFDGLNYFGAFRCLNPRMVVCTLIAYRVLINSKLSMASMKNRYLWG